MYDETEKTIAKERRACPVASAPARLTGGLCGQAGGGCARRGRAYKYIHPPVNEDGYIVVTIPVTLMGGNSAEDVIADFQNSEQYDHEGETAPTDRITDIEANTDGSVNYIFSPEQFEKYKTETFETGRFQYGFGSFPSIQSAEYSEVDAAGIPWAITVFVDKTDYEANLPFSSLYATAWPATYLGQYHPRPRQGKFAKWVPTK